MNSSNLFSVLILVTCLSIAHVLLPARIFACSSATELVVKTESCSFKVNVNSDIPIEAQVRRAQETCKIARSDIDDLLALLKKSLHVKVFEEVEFKRLEKDLNSAKERKCREFKLLQRGKWLGYTTARGKYDVETGRCLLPKC